MSAAHPNDLISLEARPDADTEFASFSGGCSSNTTRCQVNMDTDKTVTVNWVFRPMLSIQIGGVAGKGHVTSVGIDCDGANATCQTRIDGNTQLVLTATPNAGARFDGWSGACSGLMPTCIVTMDARKTVIANFADASSAPPNSGGGGGGGGGRFDLLSLLALGLVGVWRMLRPTSWVESSTAA